MFLSSSVFLFTLSLLFCLLLDWLNDLFLFHDLSSTSLEVYLYNSFNDYFIHYGIYISYWSLIIINNFILFPDITRTCMLTLFSFFQHTLLLYNYILYIYVCKISGVYVYPRYWCYYYLISQHLLIYLLLIFLHSLYVFNFSHKMIFFLSNNYL